MTLPAIMKTALNFIFSALLISCFSSKTITQKNNATFHEDVTAKIIITSVDSSSVELYDLYRFQFHKESKNGILLKLKGDTTTFLLNELIEVDLCDIGEFLTLFRASDTTYVGNVPLIYGEQDGLIDNIDTIHYRGHFMLNGILTGENDEILLDFGNNASEPVFEICKK